MFRFALVLLLLVMSEAWGEPAEDRRTLVQMPAETQIMLRLEMMDHMAAVNELIGYLGNDDLDAVAAIAERRLGMSSMGAHRGTGMGPGRFMPPGMRKIGLGMHRDASQLAQTASLGDLKASVAALQQVTAACVACHNAYRVR